MIHGMINYNLSAAPGAVGPDGENDGTREVLALDWQMTEFAADNPDVIAALGMRFMRAIVRSVPEDRREQVRRQAMLGMEALLVDYRNNSNCATSPCTARARPA